jgi:NAD(P)-dependent dehydrogenase (short-subunit alcohol dehydrogenase family)
MDRGTAPGVLITGCSSGIGRALVTAFAERRHRVLATARDRADDESLAGSMVRTARLDVTDRLQ